MVMKPYELAGVSIFIIFWGLIYSLEIKYFFSFLRKKIFPKSRFVTVIHILAIVGIACLIYSYFIEPYWLDVRYIKITTDKIKNTNLTIVQISDLHLENKIRNERKLSKIINNLNPDVIVFTGDTLNALQTLSTFKEVMSGLKAKIGKYAVRGNFDIWLWGKTNLFTGTGFVELNGRIVTLLKNHEKFTISGLNVARNFNNFYFLDSLSPNVYNVLLFHYPGINEEVGDAPIDLFLSGHTHGGQVRIPFYGALVTLSKYGKKYESGQYDLDGKVLYVNRGIGMESGTSPRVRFLARPEITVFHIQPKNNK